MECKGRATPTLSRSEDPSPLPLVFPARAISHTSCPLLDLEEHLHILEEDSRARREKNNLSARRGSPYPLQTNTLALGGDEAASAKTLYLTGQ